ncbi:MAG: agglutinin biogenesis protein MshP [Burkholderiales bacterium]
MSRIFLERTQRGFSMMSAIFLIVVLALLGAAMAKFSIMQHTSSTLDFEGVRAYQAARAGIEWGLYRILDPDTAPSATLPSCWAGSANVTLGGDLSPFTTLVSCTSASTTEDTDNITVYRIVATASQGTAGTQNYIERQVESTVSRCATPAAPFTC